MTSPGPALTKYVCYFLFPPNLRWRRGKETPVLSSQVVPHMEGKGRTYL